MLFRLAFSMRSFVRRAVAFFCVFAAITAIGLSAPLDTPGGSLHLALRDKHERLRLPSTRPRLIIVGGSNASVGIYSPKIEHALGVDVTNMAVTFGYGLKFMLDDVAADLREGDTVVVIPEYNHFVGNNASGGAGLVEAVRLDVSKTRLLDSHQWRTIISHAPAIAVQHLRQWTVAQLSARKPAKGIYNRAAFNEHGDVVAHWGQPSKRFANVDVSGPLNTKTVAMLARFVSVQRDRNIDVVVSYPSLNRGSFELSEPCIQEIAKAIRSTGVRVLGSPERYRFDDDLHYDTHYHLCESAQKLRTELFIDDLRELGIGRDQ